MAKVIRGRAGREQRRDEILEEYGATLARMLHGQVRPDPAERVLHLGSPGAAQFANVVAPQLQAGELVLYVYTYDELEDLRAALAGIGNVHVINEIEDLDEDEPPFDIISCIAPFQLGRDSVNEMLEHAVARLAADGRLFLAGDKQHDLDRFVETLSGLARDVQQVAANGQYRVVSVQGRNVRRKGRIGERKN